MTYNVYLAGPMRGLPESNYPAFNSLDAWLVVHGMRDREGPIGVFNPARNFDGDQTREYAEYMRADLPQLSRCAGIILLPGWRESYGARLEVEIAIHLGLDFYEAIPGRKIRNRQVGWKVQAIVTPANPRTTFETYFELPTRREPLDSLTDPEQIAARLRDDWERANPAIDNGWVAAIDWASAQAEERETPKLDLKPGIPTAYLPEIPRVQADDGRTTTFASGATRDTSAGKLDFEGFYNPLVVERFAQYMDKNRLQSNGKLRNSDNWQGGFTRASYMKSMFRHFMDVWHAHRATGNQRSDIEEALCAVIFNAQGYLFEILLDRDLQEG